MAEKTAIEWADSTLNTAWGCTKVSTGCDNCYMFRLSKMYGRTADKFQPRKMDNIRRDIRKLGSHKVVFLNSMTDTFHEDAPDDMIRSILDLLEKTDHTYIMLTKRIARARRFFEQVRPVPLNFWIGTSIEGRHAFHRLGPLKKIKCPVKFVSLEPLLESVDGIDLSGIQWCIVGGESDFKSPRPFDDHWASEVLAECRRTGTKFFYKQSGGKRKHGGIWGTNELHGKTYLEMPELLHTKQSTL